MDLIFLHGPAASGKLTVGRALAAATGYPLFHNHLVVDAVGAVFPFGSEPFVRLRQAFWLQTFAAAARAGRSLIFTFAPEATVPADFVGEAVAAVEGAGGRVRFVALKISPEEQLRRVENPDRARFNKLNSAETLQRLRAAGAETMAGAPPAELVLDTEALSPQAAARAIVEAFALAPAATPHRMFED